MLFHLSFEERISQGHYFSTFFLRFRSTDQGWSLSQGIKTKGQGTFTSQICQEEAKVLHLQLNFICYCNQFFLFEQYNKPLLLWVRIVIKMSHSCGKLGNGRWQDTVTFTHNTPLSLPGVQRYLIIPALISDRDHITGQKVAFCFVIGSLRSAKVNLKQPLWRKSENPQGEGNISTHFSQLKKVYQ